MHANNYLMYVFHRLSSLLGEYHSLVFSHWCPSRHFMSMMQHHVEPKNITLITIFVNWRLFHDLEANQGLQVRYRV